MFKRIILGISGGVDSAVSAFLLKNKGYDVHAVYMQNWDIADEQGFCQANEDYKDAVEVCKVLNIPIHHVNFVKQYWHEVFSNLVKEYETGYTPNPDIVCNKKIKFNYFIKYAFENFQADAIATGHYARTNFGSYLEKYEPEKAVKLLMAADTKKDQTFFLSQVKQDALRRIMFPLGDMTKDAVKKLAKENGLEKFANKKESMGICFIGDRNFQTFISQYIDDKEGNFVDIDTGKVVGTHKGIHKWTLGQRTKIQGVKDAFFTVRKDAKNNTIYVAAGTEHPALYGEFVYTSEPHWICAEPAELVEDDIMCCKFKFQHVESLIDCVVCKTSKGLIVHLSRAKRALTPGQFAVFYKDGECLGSAKIAHTSPSNFFLYNKTTSAIDVLNKYKNVQ